MIKMMASQGHEMFCSFSGGHGFEPWSDRTCGAVSTI